MVHTIPEKFEETNFTILQMNIFKSYSWVYVEVVKYLRQIIILWEGEFRELLQLQDQEWDQENYKV